MLTVVGLHRQGMWKDSLSEDLPPPGAAGGVVAVMAVADYYIRAYKLSPGVAATEAETAIGILSASIYNGCEG
jgi:hypothetical protein